MSEHPTIDHVKLNGMRAELGAHFARLLSYFAEDGVKSLNAIDDAVRARDAAALVRPAHTLKGESLQFGANALGYASEHVEALAREAVEARTFPEEVVDYSACLRPLFEEALRALKREATPPIAPGPLRRAGGFGRKVA